MSSDCRCVCAARGLDVSFSLASYGRDSPRLNVGLTRSDSHSVSTAPRSRPASSSALFVDVSVARLPLSSNNRKRSTIPASLAALTSLSTQEMTSSAPHEACAAAIRCPASKWEREGFSRIAEG